MPSSPPRTFADLAGARVGIFGFGMEGRTTLARLATLGATPATIVDDEPVDPSVVVTGEGGLDALLGCEVVVKAPGISRYRDDVVALVDAGVEVVGALGLWLEEHGAPGVVGVTGTKGKSTTVNIAGHLARGLGRRPFVGGNIGRPPWDPAVDWSAHDLVVVEVSSYQATDLWSSPEVAVVTSLHEDHLDWHGSVERYYADKLSLCGHPGGRITLANGDDERLRARGAALRPDPTWVAGGDPEPWTEAFGLRGRHNRVNARLAAAALAALGVDGADDPDRLAAAARGYEPLPHRLTTVAEVNGVEYVDDSLSTNVLPTIAALEVFAGRPVALLAGGHDRRIDYEPLASYLAARAAPTLLVALPPSGVRIGEAARAAGVEVVDADDMTDAVAAAGAWCRGAGGGVVLLSPAAPSYGVYRNHVERADAFAAAIDGTA
jgi:UDP-N-acetylmuramoylalanine--D-glutamate ligase